MKYMLLMYANELDVPKTPEEQQAVAPAVWYALMEEMKAAGVLLSNNGLCPGRQCDDCARSGGQDVDHRRSLRRNARAIGWILFA